MSAITSCKFRMNMFKLSSGYGNRLTIMVGTVSSAFGVERDWLMNARAMAFCMAKNPSAWYEGGPPSCSSGNLPSNASVPNSWFVCQLRAPGKSGLEYTLNSPGNRIEYERSFGIRKVFWKGNSTILFLKKMWVRPATKLKLAISWKTIMEKMQYFF